MAISTKNHDNPAGRPWALVTASSRGLGAHVARELADAGYRIVLTGRDHAMLTTTAQSLTGSGHLFYQQDVRSEVDALSLLSFLSEHTVLPKVVVHNLGLSDPEDRHPISALVLHRVLFVNLQFPMLLNAHLAPPMAAQSGGAIAFVGSDAALSGRAAPAYVASKAGLLGVARNLATQYDDAQLRSFVALPSMLDHDGGVWARRQQQDPLWVAQRLAAIGRTKLVSTAWVAKEIVARCLRRLPVEPGASVLLDD